MAYVTRHLRPLVIMVTTMFLIGLPLVCAVSGETTCLKGYHKDKDPDTGEERCVVCEKGTYMSSDDHSHDNCWPCTSEPHEGSRREVKLPCTWKTDTEIGCIENNYRHPVSIGGYTCMTCTECQKGEIEVKACIEFHDRKCKTDVSNPDKSNGEEMTALDVNISLNDKHDNGDNINDNQNIKEDGVKRVDEKMSSDRIVNEEITCSKGYHKDKDPDTGEERCVVCEAGTYMSSDDHSHDNCWPCTSEPHEGSRREVKRPCTWKTDTEIGCIENTYRHPVSIGGYTCMTCTECQKGEIEVKACIEFHDRKCKSFDFDNSDKEDNGDNDTNKDNIKNAADVNDDQGDRNDDNNDDTKATTASTINNNVDIKNSRKNIKITKSDDDHYWQIAFFVLLPVIIILITSIIYLKFYSRKYEHVSFSTK